MFDIQAVKSFEMKNLRVSASVVLVLKKNYNENQNSFDDKFVVKTKP